jgi:hypothetical protein
MIVLLALMPSMSLFAQGRGLLVHSPMQGKTVNGSTVTVHFETPGIKVIASTVKLEEAGKHPEANHPGEGHLHLMLDLQPMVVWGQSDPYTFENVPPGDHVLSVEIVENDHSSFTPPLLQQIHFTSVAAPTAPAVPETITSLPNSGFTSVASQPATFALLTVSGLLIVVGSRIRRRQM